EARAGQRWEDLEGFAETPEQAQEKAEKSTRGSQRGRATRGRGRPQKRGRGGRAACGGLGNGTPTGVTGNAQGCRKSEDEAESQLSKRRKISHDPSFVPEMQPKKSLMVTFKLNLKHADEVRQNGFKKLEVKKEIKQKSARTPEGKKTLERKR